MSGEPVTRTFMVIDIEGSSQRTNPGVTRMRRQLYEIFDYTRSASGIPQERVSVEDRGDGIMAVADAELLAVLDRGLDALIEDLAAHNRNVQPPEWLRLRVALNRGLVHRDEHGWSGADLTATFRLIDDEQVKAALRRADRAQCVVVVSDAVYNGLIKQGYGNLSPDAYAPLEGKRGWVRVPGYPIPPVTGEPGAGHDRADRRDETTTAPGTVYGNLFQGNTISHVDASIHPDRGRQP
jgi:hypothetical protein